MPDSAWDLLTEGIFTVDSPGTGRVKASLPQVLAALAAGQAVEFSALGAHQLHAWHAFLVQLAALALLSGGTDERPASDAQWAHLLRLLAAGKGSAWHLVVADLSEPAFMQPPVPEGSLRKWPHGTRWPDEIDVLETAKNHDVKTRRIASPAPEHWVYALVSLQTMQGYSGKNNYGIARMNGGYGSRPGIAAAHDPAWTTRFTRDVRVLLAQRPELFELGYDREAGLALLWLVPWHGTDGLALKQLDPFFIEICRRIRLEEREGAIWAHWTTTQDRRIAADQLKGNLGDPWVPVRLRDAAALTAKDLHYQRVHEIIFGGDFKPAPASEIRAEDGDTPLLMMQVMARDQGKTAGYHERFIPVPPKARSLLAVSDGRRRIGTLSKERVELVAEVTRGVLRPALVMLLQADPTSPDFTDERARPFIDAFDDRIDAIFFARLFDDVGRDPVQMRELWIDEILQLAREALDKARTGAPIPSAHRYRAWAAAQRVFNGAAWKLRPAQFNQKRRKQ